MHMPGKRCALFTGFILLSVLALQGQNTLYQPPYYNLDSAIRAVERFPAPDSDRANALSGVYNHTLFYKNQKKVEPYALEALSISRQIGFTKGMADAYYFLGLLNKSGSRYDSAMIYFDSTILVSRNARGDYLQNKRALAERSLAQVYDTYGDYEPALQHYLQSLRYYENHFTAHTVFLYANIAAIYEATGVMEKALEYSKRCCTAAEQLGDTNVLAAYYLSHVENLIKVENTSEAIVYLDKTAPLMPLKTDPNTTSMFYVLKAAVFRMEKNYPEAVRNLDLALPIAEGSGHGFSLFRVLDAYSRVGLESGDMALTEQYAGRYLAEARKLDAKAGQRDALNFLAQLARSGQDYRNAYQYLAAAQALGDTLIREANLKQINLLESRYQSEKKQREILQLQKDKEFQALELRQKSRMNGILAGALALLCLAIFLGYRNLRNRQRIARQRAELQSRKIREMEKDRQFLASAALLEGQEEERKRLAKDLHDGLGGFLSGIKYSLGNMKENLIVTPDNMALFERSMKMLDDSIQELRRVAHNMMPQSLVQYGLDTALKDFCSDMNRSGAVRVVCQTFGLDERPLDTPVSIGVYRIVQELVNNILKHAGAANAVVQVSLQDNRMQITVEDDGSGFDPASLSATGRGMGWSNIRSRVNYLNGRTDIQSAPGQGTSVNIEFSL